MQAVKIEVCAQVVIQFADWHGQRIQADAHFFAQFELGDIEKLALTGQLLAYGRQVCQSGLINRRVIHHLLAAAVVQVSAILTYTPAG